MYTEKEDIKKLAEAIVKIENQSKRERRALSKKESGLVAEMRGKIRDLQMKIPESPRTVQNFGGGQSDGIFRSMGEQFQAIAQAASPGQDIDRRLFDVRAATGLGETVGSEGGFLVQQDFSSEILTNAFLEDDLARRCRRQPISGNSNSIKINGVDETSRETGSRFGGVRSYWMAEADEKTASKPTFRQIELNLKKNVVLVYATDELLSDSAALESYIKETAPKEISFSVSDSIFRGTGAGQPLGILNSGCLVSVAKESGQAADTIVAENIVNMVKRTLGKTSNYVWLYNKSCLDQIYSLSLAVGTGGIPLFMAGGSIPEQPENRLLGLPMVEIEQASALGDLGDIVLADLGNGYILADKGGVQSDMSIHVRVIYDESVFRFVHRVDGQPILSSAITPYKGGATNTQSHFIALAERA